mgnify:CR=1 FL=1
MAKLSSTVYLEGKFRDIINQYQRENDISSRNDAIQMILLEYSLMKDMKATPPTMAHKSKPKEEKKEQKVDQMFMSGLSSIMNSMK